MAKDQRRLFSDTQKCELLEAASHKCQGESCTNRDLSNGQKYEFHHVKRHADGGLTSTLNGMVLCVECHRKAVPCDETASLGSVWGILRDWQKEAVSRFIKSDSRVFVLEAAPGSGKTLFAACVARYELDSESEVSHVICVAPWKPILVSMQKAFGLMKLDVRDKFHYDRKRGELQVITQGDVTLDTYSGFCNQDTVNVIKAWQARHGFKFMLILDEVHHTNIVSGTWGPYAEEVASLAAKIVVMSGTFFRSDSRAISFLEYEESGPRLDYQIRYPECVAMRYVRSVAFRFCDPELVVYKHRLNGTKRHVLSKIPRSSAKMLAAAKFELLNPKGDHVAWMITEAWRELQRFRTKWPDAACLVVCQSGGGKESSDERMIHEVARRISELTSQQSVVVTSDDAASHGRLSAFSTNGATDPFLCAIRMVSEGVDIPRIRVVLFLSYTDSEMLFRQIVGRGLRYIDGKEDDTAALVVMPRFPVMADFAERFEEDVRQGIADVRFVPPDGRPGPGGGGPWEPRQCDTCGETPCCCFVVVDSESGEGGGRYSDTNVPERFIQKAKVIADSSHAHAHINTVQMGDFLHKAASIDALPVSLDCEGNKELLLRNVNNIVGKIARFKYSGEISECWRREVHQQNGIETIDEIRGTWRAAQIQDLVDRLKTRFVEVLTHG